MSNKDILKKIADLKRLSDRPGTEAEALSAISAMRRLMIKHDITEAEMEAAGKIEIGAPVEDGYDLGSNSEWRKTIINNLANVNNCAVLFRSGDNFVSIFGKEAGIAVTVGMYEYLVSAINRLADEEWKKSTASVFEPRSVRRWKHAFRVAAAVRVVSRVIAQNRVDTDKYGKANEIMISDLNDAIKMMNSLFNTKSSKNRLPVSSEYGRRAGDAAGGGINIDGQVGAGNRDYKRLGG